jgi:lysophospholipase L1-like esterase
MKNFFFSFFKIIWLNSLIIIFFLILIEIFFGYWFDKDNFGPYMREHRMKNQQNIWEYKNEVIKYNYKRNYYGFRADDIKPSDIKAIILGGSVIDQRYTPLQYTITGFLNKNLKKNNINLEVINAGVDGQSTRGMISGFENWLFKIKDFKPRFVLIYVGINDQFENDDKIRSKNDGHLLNPDKNEIFGDNLRSRSIIYDKLRIFKYKYLSNKKKFIKHNFNKKIEKSYIENFNFIRYAEGKKRKKNYQKTKTYLKRIDILQEYSNKLYATPIFITGITSAGHTEKTFTLNNALMERCRLKNYLCIDLARKLEGKVEYWYDGIHTTKEGSKVIADLITPELISIIKLKN